MESKQMQSHFPLKPKRRDIAWSPPVSKNSDKRCDSAKKIDFFGFGAAPPPIRKHPHRIQKLEERKVLKDAEMLVQVMLGNEDEKLTSDSIQKVLEKHTATQTKSRYKTLLAKPWRTTPEKWEPNGRHKEDSSELNVYERIENFEIKNPQSFRLRRSSTSDVDTGSFFARAKSMYNENFGIDDDDGRKLKAELAEAAVELKAQKSRIAFLKEQITVLQTSSSKDLNMSFLSDGGDELYDQVERLQYRLRDAEAARDEYRGKLKELETKPLNAEPPGLQNRLAQLEEKLASAAAMHSDETQKLKQDLDNAKMENEVSEANVKVLEKHLTDAKQIIEDKEAELKIRSELTQDRFVKFESMLEDANAETREVKDQLTESEMENMNLKLRLEEMERTSIERSRLISSDDERQMQIDELMKKLAIAEARLIEGRDDGEQDRRVLQDRLDEVEKQLTVSEGKANNAENAAAEVVREKVELQKRVTTLQQQVQSKSNDESSHSAETKKLRDTIASLEEKLANQETQLRNTAQLNSIESVHATQELKNAKAILQYKEDELESCKLELSTKKEELHAVERKLRQLEEQQRAGHSELENKLLQSEKKAHNLERELDQLKSLNAELVEVNLHNADEELQQSGQRRTALEKSRDEAANRAFKSEALVVELNQKLAAANAMSRDAAAQLEDLEAAKSQELEILKDELRESENTIACLMEDLDLLKPLAIDLEEAEKDLSETVAQLEKCKRDLEELKSNHEADISVLKESLEQSEQHIVQLNDELKLLLPLATELEQVKNELGEVKARTGPIGGDLNGDLRVFHHKLEHDATVLRQQLEAKADALKLAEQRASALVVAHSAEKERLSARYMESENENAHLSDELDSLRKKLSRVESQLSETESRASALEAELEPLKEKVESIDAAHMHLEAVDNLERILEQKEKEIDALQKQVDVQEHQIISCRTLVQDLEEERNYSRARMTELSGFLDGAGEPQKLLQEKMGQVAKLTAERDTLQQKLKVVEAMATSLEHDNEQKTNLLRELMKTSCKEDSTTAFMEKLQSEHERTLRRCSDLSLQLAESQFKIDELTEKIRKAKKPKGPPPVQNPKTMSRSNSFHTPVSSRASIKAMFAHGVDRILSGDDTAGEESEISRSIHGIMTGSPLKAFRRQRSMENRSER